MIYFVKVCKQITAMEYSYEYCRGVDIWHYADVGTVLY